MSLTNRLMETVAKEGPFESMGDTIAAVGTRGEAIGRAEVISALYVLQRQGKVKIRERDGRLTHVEATKAGYIEAGVPYKPVSAEVGSRASKTLPGRPGDPTDFRNQPHVAPGGPIEVTRQAAAAPVTSPSPKRKRAYRRREAHYVSERLVSVVHQYLMANARGLTILEIVRATGESQTGVGDALKKLAERGFATRKKARKSRGLHGGAYEWFPATAAHTPLHQNEKPYVPVEPKPIVRPTATVEIEAYPLLRQLQSRTDKLLQAAALLEELGLREEADELLSKNVSYSELEQEYLRFAQAHS